MRRRRGFRGWAIVWAVLQFALPAAATYADARLERETASAPGAHVEAHTGSACRPEHPAECGLCQVVTRTSAPATPQATCPEIVLVVEQAVVADRPQRALDGG